MIGLSVLGALGLWLLVTFFFTYKIPKWLGISNYKSRTVFELILFPLLLVIPIADDLYGMWQFKQLCEREAVITLSPNWKFVKKARYESSPVVYINQFIVPISVQESQYIDIDSNKPFMKRRSFNTQGGLLRRSIQIFGMSSCHPKNSQFISKKINLDELMKNGENQ